MLSLKAINRNVYNTLNRNVEVNVYELDGIDDDFLIQERDKDNGEDLKRTLNHYFVHMDQENDLREQKSTNYDHINSPQGNSLSN